MGEVTGESADTLFENALSNPIEFPPLSQVIFEGDTIAFVLLADVQATGVTLSGLLNHLYEFIQPCTIDIVSTQPIEWDEDVQQSWIDRLEDKNVVLKFVVHDKTDSQQHAFLAASLTGEPIYINRTLFDADTVIPITTTVNVDADGRPQLYPEFSNLETSQRFQAGDANLFAESRMAAESLGICFVIAVAFGPGGQIQHVQSGEYSQVAKHHPKSADSPTQIQPCDDARVVVATVETPESNQTWDHFFHALISAAAASVNVQQIVICTSLESLPTDLHRQLLQIPFELDCQLLDQVFASAPDVYRVLPGIFEEATVFLQSQLSESDVEELGLGFVADDADIQRIIDNAESGLILRDAHLCKIATVE